MHPLILFTGKSGRFTPHRGGTLNPPRCSERHRTGAQNEVEPEPLRRKAGAKSGILAPQKRYIKPALAVDSPRISGRFTPQKIFETRINTSFLRGRKSQYY